MSHAIAPNPGFHFDLFAHPQTLSTEAPESALEATAYVTLQHRGLLTLNGPEGDEYYRLVSRPDSAPWNVARLEKNRLSANFQGNPLWPVRVLQNYPQLREYFGLNDAATELSCILPLARTINAKMQSLTQSSFAFQLIEDYPRDSHGHIDTRDYVDTFIDQRKLPMAELTDRDSIHDWSYHFVTLLFSTYLENVRLNLLYIRENLDRFHGTTRYAWNYYGHTLDSEGQMRGKGVIEEMDARDAVYRQMAIALDVATAKPVQLLGLEQKGLIEKCPSEVEAIRVFSDGVRQEAVHHILWMEESLEAKLNAPAKESQQHDILKAFHHRLTELNRRAAQFVRPDLSNLRQAAFRAALKTMDSRNV